MTGERPRSESGFALAALIFFLTAAAILAAAAVPSYQMQAKRAQEEELIFRGEEYMRAIQKYRLKVGIYPPSIDALLETNGLRFLRKAYLDPMTGKPFRLLLINPDGSVTGSVLLNQPNSNAAQSLFGTPGALPSGAQTLGSGPGNASSPFGQSGLTGSTGLSGSAGSTGLSGLSGQNGGLKTGNTPTGGAGSAGSAGGLGSAGNPAGFMQQGGIGTTPSNGRGGVSGAGGTGGGFGAGGNSTGTSAGIIGVASESDKDSVKIYNTRQKYNEWEFIAIPSQNNPLQGGQNPSGAQDPNGTGGTNSQPPFGPAPQSQPGMPRGQNTTRPSQPFGFGPSPTQSPGQSIKRPN